MLKFFSPKSLRVYKPFFFFFYLQITTQVKHSSNPAHLRHVTKPRTGWVIKNQNVKIIVLFMMMKWGGYVKHLDPLENSLPMLTCGKMTSNMTHSTFFHLVFQKVHEIISDIMLPFASHVRHLHRHCCCRLFKCMSRIPESSAMKNSELSDS